jgi:2-succinyl-6-hydroxy-2,4-cyclohexadiene-1-carboxylate synthase
VPESVVLLHGFSGTRRAWDGVAARLQPERYLPRVLDLPGHGENADLSRHPAPAVPVVGGPWGEPAPPTSSIPGHGEAADSRGAYWETITFEGCVDHVLAEAPERFTLCGYSLGGRVALHLALSAPERVSRLVLVSTSAGIEDPIERAERRAADHRLADELERGGRAGFDSFIERWRTQALFADEPPEVGALAREDQRRNRAEALAAVLRGIGTGEMAPLWDRLPELTMPATVLVGERDGKFVALGRRMAELLGNAELMVVAGGHGLPLENPAAVARAIEG